VGGRLDGRSVLRYREESPDSMGRALGNSQAEQSDTSTTENKPPMANATGSHLVAAAQVRVKRWGKSPPRGWRHHRHGKRRLVQGQIGRHVQRSSRTVVRRLARSRSSGRSLEVRGNSNPREMIIQAKRATSLRDRIRLIGLPLTLLLKRLVASALGDSRGAVLTGLDGDARISNLSP